MHSENIEWLRRVWRSPDRNATFWHRVRASVALLLDRHDEAISEDYDERDAVAYVDRGFYSTDYGDGRAFEALHVRGWRFAIISDGTL